MKITAIVVIALTTMVAALAIFVQTFDWNRARPFINREVSKSLGRDFAIRGDLKLRFVQGVVTETGWRRYVPRPQIEASDVQVANLEGSKVGATMVDAKKITVALHPLALLGKHVVLTDVVLDRPVVNLERRPDGKGNWSIGSASSTASSPSAWTIEMQRLALSDGMLRYLDDIIDLDLSARLSSVAASKDALVAGQLSRFGVQFELGGRYRQAPVKGSGRVGGLLQLAEEKTIFPVQANAELGKNKVAVDGTLSDPRSLSAIDLQLTLGGDSMADLYPLTGVLLPKTPAYTTHGRLTGTRENNGWSWAYRDFKGRVGGSDLAGTLAYRPRQPRPLLTGAVTSRQLRLEDLAPTVGADTNVQKKAHGKPSVQPAGKALPVEQFSPDKWGTLDADVRFSGAKLVRPKAIPLQDVVAELHLKDKVLSLTPLDFGMADGRVTSNISLDGRQPQIQAQIRTAARHLKVRSLFPTLQSMQASFGEVNGDAALTGRGNSVAAMLGSADGEIGATVSEGSVSRFILEAAGLNIPNAVFAKVFGDKQEHLNCMASEFTVKRGRADVRRFVLDTTNARIDVTGSIDAATETLDLDINPKTKGARIISLRTPLYAKGTFSNPDIGLYKGPIALKAAAVGVLAAIAPVAAVLPLVKLGDVPEFDCASALAQAVRTRQSPKTPATSAPARPVTQDEVKKAQAGRPE